MHLEIIVGELRGCAIRRVPGSVPLDEATGIQITGERQGGIGALNTHSTSNAYHPSCAARASSITLVASGMCRRHERSTPSAASLPPPLRESRSRS